jgi:hypothetical protein
VYHSIISKLIPEIQLDLLREHRLKFHFVLFQIKQISMVRTHFYDQRHHHRAHKTYGGDIGIIPSLEMVRVKKIQLKPLAIYVAQVLAP